MGERTLFWFQCMKTHFHAIWVFLCIFVLVLAMGVCRLVLDSPLMFDTVCGADRSVKWGVALLTPS